MSTWHIYLERLAPLVIGLIVIGLLAYGVKKADAYMDRIQTTFSGSTGQPVD